MQRGSIPVDSSGKYLLVYNIFECLSGGFSVPGWSYVRCFNFNGSYIVIYGRAGEVGEIFVSVLPDQVSSVNENGFVERDAVSHDDCTLWVCHQPVDFGSVMVDS